MCDRHHKGINILPKRCVCIVRLQNPYCGKKCAAKATAAGGEMVIQVIQEDGLGIHFIRKGKIL